MLRCRLVPCGDVTEVIDLVLDDQDRLRSYALVKRTCGAEIGSSTLIADWLTGLSGSAILHLEDDEVLERFAPPPDEEFLYVKHLRAVKHALAVLTGERRGREGDPCTTVSVAASDEGVVFQGHVAVELLTQKIKSCGGCGSCGSK